VLDMLSEVGMLGCKLVYSPMDVNSKLLPDQKELLDNSGPYMRLVGKLNYFTMTRLILLILLCGESVLICSTDKSLACCDSNTSVFEA